MHSQLIYVAAPYGDPDPSVVAQRMQAYLTVDAILLKQGKFTVSPLAKHFGLTVSQSPSDWKYWQSYSRAMLDQCEALIVIKLNGWDHSVGVKGEIEYAHHINLPIYYVDEQGQMTSFGGVR